MAAFDYVALDIDGRRNKGVIEAHTGSVAGDMYGLGREPTRIAKIFRALLKIETGERLTWINLSVQDWGGSGILTV